MYQKPGIEAYTSCQDVSVFTKNHHQPKTYKINEHVYNAHTFLAIIVMPSVYPCQTNLVVHNYSFGMTYHHLAVRSYNVYLYVLVYVFYVCPSKNYYYQNNILIACRRHRRTCYCCTYV